jgi:hypothetical protein
MKVRMNRFIGLSSILWILGIAAAQTAPLPSKPFFDIPLFLPAAAFSGTAEPVDQDGPSTPAEVHVPSPQVPAPEPVDKRAFGVIPNYRTADGTIAFVPITPKQKFAIAVKDSFDYPVFLTTSFFAGLSQLQGSDNDVYGQGLKGFAHRYGISYADQVIGNFFPEAIVPSLLHMDPRYFRKGQGSVPSRLGYAMGRIFVSKNDKGNTTFNSPEILGNALAAMTGLTYHIHERTLGDAVYQWGFTYITSDMIGQIIKEFWPDVKHKFQKHKSLQ